MSSPEKSSFYWRRYPQYIGGGWNVFLVPSRSLDNHKRNEKEKEELDRARSLDNRKRNEKEKRELDRARSLDNRKRNEKEKEELDRARSLDNSKRNEKEKEELNRATSLDNCKRNEKEKEELDRARSLDNYKRNEKEKEELDRTRSLDNRKKNEKHKEELDRAIALSLAEDLKRPSGYKWQPGNANDLAKSHQDDFHSSYTSYRVCRACGYPITAHEFSLSGKDAYHKSCFKESTHPKCEVCFQFIPTNGAGLIDYRCHPFWSQKYCSSHEHDNTPRCCSCERLECVNARYISLGDGRSLCLECMESAIMDTGECQPLYHSIRDFYEGMNMRIDQQIPLLLVERHALYDASVGEKNGFHYLPDTRGLCLSEEQTVTSIQRRPRMGGQRLVGMRSQPLKLTRRCEVTAILALYGLPRLLTGSILAHELMHGWLRLKGYRNLNPEVEEGICQVLSYMWLESEIMPGLKSMPSSSSSSSSKKGVKSRYDNKLGEFYMHQIAHDASPAYGGGFRAANAAVNTYGLRRTLDHIRLTGSFPL